MIVDFGARLPTMNKMRKNFLMVVTGVALLLPCTGKLAAGDSYRLDTSVYVFKNSDFQSVKLPAAKGAGDNGAVVVRSPATIEFDQETLSLNGADISWSGGRNPPERFTLVKIPEIITAPGKPVEILSTAPIQYIEKEADGTLQVRNIGKDSADAPHWRIRFTVVSPDETSEDLRVSCNLDWATVSARANVPGVSLDVGRPLLARFQDRIELTVRSGEWAALLLRAPNGSDYSLLLLLKTMPAQASDTRGGQADRRMTAEELAVFVTYYYRHPQPELIARAIESLAPTKFLDKGDMSSYLFHQSAYTCVGFFAEVFAANPDRVAEWEKLIDRWGQDGTTRFWLRKALRLRRPGAILAIGLDNPPSCSDLDQIYVFWGAFFASGNPTYLRKLVDRLKSVDDANQTFFDAGAEAMVLFAYNGPHHPLVRQTLEAARKDVRPRTRELIDDLLNKDLAAVVQEVLDMDHDPSSHPGHYRDWLPWRRPLLPPTPGASNHN